MGAGIVESRRGSARLKRPSELDEDLVLETEARLTVWEITHYPIREFESGGESAVAALAA